MEIGRGNNCSNSTFISMLNKVALIVCFLLYGINELILKPMQISKFFQGHFNDVLGIIIILAYTNIVMSMYKKRVIKIVKLTHILIYTISVGFYWEVITPLYKHDSTGDWYDMLSYILGAVIYKWGLWFGNRIRRGSN